MTGTVYIGTSLANAKRARDLMTRFAEAGVVVTYDWTKHGQVFAEEDLRRVGEAERRGISEADLFFMIQPGRSGTHVEFGIALTLGKPIIILEEVEVEKKSFYYLPGIHRLKTEDDAVALAISLIRERHKNS